MPATALNLAWLLEHQARLTPDRLAVVCGGHRLTYAQLNRTASQAASALRAIGLGPGDHVALSCPNTPHFVVAYFAILKMGGVVVPLHVLLKPREMAYHLRDSDAKALLVFEGTAELPMAQWARAACDEAGTCGSLVVMTIDPAAPSPVERARTLGQIMYGQSPAFETHAPAPDDTAVILYTSGTTGQSKGAELTHFNMFMNAIFSRDLVTPLLGVGLDIRSVTLITLPLFHSTGQTGQMNAGIAGGFTLVLLPRFDPAAVLQAIAEEQVNYWIGVPAMYWALLEYVRTLGIDVRTASAALRVCASGGAPMPAPVLHEFERTFGVRILEGYGLSETSPVACFNHVFRPSKPGSVGQPLLACDVRVVNERDEPVPAGEPGEIVMRGHNVMKGYYNRPAETAEALRNGWFHTDDIGVFDEAGDLSIVDRKKDLILRGGMNVYPREIEDVLQTHPDISQAAVIGVPHERLGEEAKAFVVLKPGAALSVETLVAWCREQMAAYKYPRLIEFRASLPLGPTGKLLKRELK